MRLLTDLSDRIAARLSPVGQWLLLLADPENSFDRIPCMLKAKHVRRLLCLADRHGVLPTALMHLRRLLDTRGVGNLVRTPMDAAVLRQSVESAQEMLVERNGLSLLLRMQVDEIAHALGAARLRAVVMKGPTFADRLYGEPSLRLFTDIDLLVSRQDLSAVEALLGQLSYSPAPGAMKYDQGYGERTWRRDGLPGGPVELHWNLVNSPTLRRGVSVDLEDLMFEPGRSGPPLPEPTPAAMLLMACVHAAASHGFDRLQMLCDIGQLARGRAGEVDTDFLGEGARRCGAALAVAMSLDLAGRMLREPACGQLLVRCELPRPPLSARLVLSRGVVIRAHHALDSFRRQIFRSMLKRHPRPM